MSLRDDILDAYRGAVEKQNPWQPYTGPAGGQGWVNMLTGEIRYQENRPAPDEGVPEDADRDAIPEPDAEVPDTLDPYEPTAEDLREHLGEGSKVTVEIDGELIEGTAVSTGEDGIEFVSDDFEVDQTVPYEAIEEHPVELEPPDGWGDGWAKPPEDAESLQQDQTVEIYDLEAGEYVEGEVRSVKDWGEDGIYTHIDGENGEIYEFLDGEPTDSSAGLLTAVEDVFLPERLDEFAPEDFEVGEEIKLWDSWADEVREVEVYDIGESGIEVKAGEYDRWMIEPDDRWEILTPEGEREYLIETGELLGAEELLPEGPGDLADYEDSYAYVEHPAEGAIEGDVEVIDHEEDGRHLYVGDSEVGIPLDDPEHPLATGLDVDAIENPYHEFDPEVDLAYLSPGDELVVDDGDRQRTVEVDAVSEDDSQVKVNGGWMDTETLASGAFGSEITMVDTERQPDVPDGAEEWKPMSDAALHHTTAGDTVWWTDSDGKPVVGVVEEVDGSMIETTEGTTVPDDVEGYADTAPEFSGSVPAYDLPPGEEVRVETRGDDGSIETANGYVVGNPEHEDEISLLMEDGSIETFNTNREGDEYAVVDSGYGVDVDLDRPNASGDPEEIAMKVEQEIGLDHTHYQLGQTEKSRLKGQLMRYFDPEAVQEFYEFQSEGGNSWKVDSGSAAAGAYESAFKDALNIDAPGRGGGAPKTETKAVAEAAAIISQRHFEAQFGEGYGLHRGTSTTGSYKLFEQFLDDPAIEEFESPFLAINNFSKSRGTAERFEGDTGTGKGAVVHWETDPEDVVAMHDYLFTEKGTHESEDEITLRGDLGPIPGENIRLNSSAHGDGVDMSLTPDEWDADHARALDDYLNAEGDDLAHSIDWDEHRVQNALELESLLSEEHGLSVQHNSFFGRVREQAHSLGIDPDEVDYSAATVGMTPSVDHYEEHIGAPVEFDLANYDGEGTIVGIDRDGIVDQIEVEEPNGTITNISPKDIEDGPIGDLEIDAEQLPEGSRVFVDDEYGGYEAEIVYETDDGYMVDTHDYGEEEVSVSDIEGVQTLPDNVDPAELHPDADPDAPDPEDFAVGQAVTLDNGLPGTHPDGLQESGYIADTATINGEEYYVVEDKYGTVIDEYTPEELAGLAEIVDEPDEEEGTDWDPVENGQSYGDQGTMPEDDEDVVVDNLGDTEGHVQYTTDDWVYVEDDAGNVYTEDPDDVYPAEPSDEESGDFNEEVDDLLDDVGLGEGVEDIEPGDEVLYEGGEGTYEVVEKPDWATDDADLYLDPEGSGVLAVDAEDVAKPDESEGSDDDWSSVAPANVHDAEPGLQEQFTLTDVPGDGEAEVEVMETPFEDGDPYEVREIEGDQQRYLVWPDGEVEPVGL